MLMRNFNPYEGHCNGTKYVITKLHSRIIEAKIAGGPYRDNMLLIPRINIKPSEKTFPFVMTRKQFPVRPALLLHLINLRVKPWKRSDFIWIETSFHMALIMTLCGAESCW